MNEEDIFELVSKLEIVIGMSGREGRDTIPIENLHQYRVASDFVNAMTGMGGDHVTIYGVTKTSKNRVKLFEDLECHDLPSIGNLSIPKATMDQKLLKVLRFTINNTSVKCLTDAMGYPFRLDELEARLVERMSKGDK